MRRIALVVAGALALAVTQLMGLAAAQDEPPLCGPPGEEVPATIVGSGTIVGTAGDDVIVGSDEDDTILGLGGDDIICGEGGNRPGAGWRRQRRPHRRRRGGSPVHSLQRSERRCPDRRARRRHPRRPRWR